MSADGSVGTREVAWRVFAAEYDDATYSYSEGERERAPNYVVTPTGGRVNRLFVVGVLTAVESVTDDVVRARIVDPTGAFVVYAGQYQPEPLAFLESVEPPAFVAVTGKARTFQPDDSDVVYTSIRPESVNVVDADARDRWVVSTAEHTLHRATRFAEALARPERGAELRAVLANAGVEERLAAGIPKAIAEYGTTEAYLAAMADLSLDAARVVAGDVEEAAPLERSPDEDGPQVLDVSFSLGDDEPAIAEASAGAVGTAADAGVDATGAEDSVATDETVATDEADSTGAVSAADDGGTSDDDSAPADESADGADTDPDAEPTVEAEPAAEGGPMAEADAAADEDPSADAGSTDDDSAAGMYELDDAEREELESEYGTEFSSGSDIPEPGEADIDTPEPDDAVDTDEPADEAEPEEADEEEEPGEADEEEEPGDVGSEAEPEGIADEAEPEETGGDLEAAEDDAGTADAEAEVEEDVGEAEAPEAADDAGDEVPEDLESVVVEYMQEMDDGDGADREALLAAVAGDYAVTTDDVEEAVQGALMSGRCFEPSDGVIKPI